MCLNRRETTKAVNSGAPDAYLDDIRRKGSLTPPAGCRQQKLLANPRLDNRRRQSGRGVTEAVFNAATSASPISLPTPGCFGIS